MNFIICSVTLCWEMQSGGLYRPPFCRSEPTSFLTSSKVRLKLNSTRRGPTSLGDVGGQGPRVLFTCVSIFCCEASLSIDSCWMCSFISKVKLLFPFGTPWGLIKKVKVLFFIYNKATTKQARVRKAKSATKLKSVFSIFATPAEDDCTKQLYSATRIALCKSKGSQAQSHWTGLYFRWAASWLTSSDQVGPPFVNN